MKRIGRRERPMAPTTILVLKRAPNCLRLRSIQRRKMVRPRMRRKMSRAAVIKEETAKRGRRTRQLCGSKGTSKEPKVKTAARKSVRTMPASIRRSRCLDLGVIGKYRLGCCWRAEGNRVQRTGIRVPCFSDYL